MPMNRVRCQWNNWPGAPGYTNLYFSTSVTDMDALKAFWTSVGALIPLGIQVVVPSSGDIVNETDGKITGTWTGTNGGTIINSGGAGVYSGTSGAIIEWRSNAVVNGHRPVGKTYIVPLKGALYDSNGSLDQTTCIAPLLAAAQGLLAAYASGLKVWSRPYTPPDDGKPHPPARVGSQGTVTAASVPDLAVTMRSRRR